MRNDRAENAGDVAGGERHDQLLALRAVRPRFRHDVFVQQFDGTFKACKLHHCVRDLSHPERDEAFVESVEAFVFHDLREALAERVGEAGLRLDADFDGF